MVLIVLLSVASSNVSLGPFAESGRDLFGAFERIGSVVTIKVGIERSTSTSWLGSTVGKQVCVVEVASGVVLIYWYVTV